MIRQVLRYLVILLFTAFVTFIYWYLYKKPLIGIDDANIYFVYIQNFAEGHGFVYNVGSERVEGFTSMLWVLLMTPLYLVGEHFELVVLFFNVVLISVILYLSVNFVNRLTQQQNFFSAPAYLFLLLIAVIPGYFDWAVLTLMETSIWSFLLVCITLLLCGDRLDKGTVAKLSICIALLVLTRPESILWGAAFIALIVMLKFLETGQIRDSWQAGVLPLAAFLTAILGLTFFRLQYFGFPLPNTYYAKVSSDLIYNIKEGIRYFIFCIFQSPLLVPLVLAIVFSLFFLLVRVYQQFRHTRTIELSKADRIQFILAFVGLVSILIPIYVGGDHFKLLRFYQPFFPIYLFVLFNLSFWKNILQVSFAFKIHRFAAIVLISLFIPFIYFLTKSPLHTFRKQGSPIDWEFRLAELGRVEGEKMNTLFSAMEKLPTVGVSAAGGFSYGYDGYVVDLMGLNNVTMAHANKKKVGMKNHAAFDKEIFHQQAPDIFHGYSKISFFVQSPADSAILENDETFLETHVYRLYKQIFTDAKFQERYSPVIIAKKEEGLYLKTYCKTDYIPQLQAKGLAVIRLQRKSKEPGDAPLASSPVSQVSSAH